MQARTRYIVQAAALGLIPALIAVGLMRLVGHAPSLPAMLLYPALVLGCMAVSVLVLWLLPTVLFTLLPRLGVRHARIAVFRAISVAAILMALAPALALALLAYRILSGTCSYPFSAQDDSLCHSLQLAGTWGFALSVPAGGFVVLLGLLMLRLSAVAVCGVTVAERARREGLS